MRSFARSTTRTATVFVARYPSLLFRRNHSTRTFDYDYFVIGAGPGGIASARRAAFYGAKVAIARSTTFLLGGTCVNLGSIPKKVMYNAATIAETIHDMEHYGFSGFDNITFDWSFLKKSREEYVRRLHDIYAVNLHTSNVKQLIGTARLDGPHRIHFTPHGDSNNDDTKAPYTITAKHILIATGGKPIIPEGPGIAEHSISSDGFFDLDHQPSKALVVGGGYVAVELAGALQALGTETTLALRKEKPLRRFDDLLSESLDKEMQLQGIEILRNTNGLARIVRDETTGLKTVHLKNGATVTGIDTVIVATGRSPQVDGLGLDTVGVEQDDGGYIVVNEFSETSAEGISAVGDVIANSIELSPTAIAAGRRVADRLYGGDRFKEAKLSYELVPTVIFSHPPIGTIGMTEQQAIDAHGDDVRIYRSKFPNLYYGPWRVDVGDKPKTGMKLVCVGSNELIVGLHVIGMGADEMLQGFAVAIKMGAKKADFDATVAIHPTAAQEFVTMYPWGRPPKEQKDRVR